MIRAALLAALALIALSCGPTGPTYRYANATFRSVDGTLLGRVPQDWRVDEAGALPPGVAARLRSSDGAASVVVRELTLDAPTRARVREEGTMLLGRLSIAFRGEGMRAALHEEDLGGRPACAYVSAESGTWTEVLVTMLDGHAVEVEATAATAEAAARASAALRAILAGTVISIRG